MTCPSGTDIALAGQLLREGKLVAFATETVYGLGGNALDPRAIAGIFAAKQRPEFDPIIAHVPDVSWLPRIVSDFHPLAQQLAAAFWPGPLTLVLPKTAAVPDLLTSGLPTVAVRVPAHPMARQLIEAAGVPVGAPSANLFGSISPTTAQHVVDQLGSRIDYVLDGGACEVGLESTVVGFITSPGGKAGAVPILLRPGGVPLEDLEDVVGPLQRLPKAAVTEEGASAADGATPPAAAGLLAPGMLPRHYAPRTGLVVVDDLQHLPLPAAGQRIGLLTLKAPPEAGRFSLVEELSPTGNLQEAAAGFFAALRRLDAADLEGILAVSFPEQGLGLALNDRLRRAAQPES